MASHDRETLKTWDVTGVADLVNAIDEAYEIVDAEGEDAYLSFVYMTAKEKNVDSVKLIKVDLTDSFAYELELT